MLCWNFRFFRRAFLSLRFARFGRGEWLLVDIERIVVSALASWRLRLVLNGWVQMIGGNALDEGLLVVRKPPNHIIVSNCRLNVVWLCGDFTFDRADRDAFNALYLQQFKHLALVHFGNALLSQLDEKTVAHDVAQVLCVTESHIENMLIDAVQNDTIVNVVHIAIILLSIILLV